MRFAGYIARFLFIAFTISFFLATYATLRVALALAFTRDPEARRRAVAALRGRILRRAMTALGATFVKLGQVMSTRPDLLDAETIDELRKLQDKLPPFPLEDVQRIVREDLGAPIEERFAEFDALPVAAASVAQVHRGRTKDGREVAVKVLRPEVRERVQRDGAILDFFARVLEWNPTARLSDPRGHLREFIGGILEQTNLRLEVDNYAHFRVLFAKVAGVRFPDVYPELSTERVMTMEFLRGDKLDALPPGDHAPLAKRLQQVFLKMCFEDGFVHADLHPGNLLLTSSGDLVIFDVGLVKRLNEGIRVQLVDFCRCLVMGDAKDFVGHLRRFHRYRGDIDWATFEVEIEGFLAHFRKQNVAELELGELISELLALARKYRVRPEAEVALVMVAMVTAEGIGKQLNPHANLFHDTAAFLVPLLAQVQVPEPKAGAA
jgi:ubiquinone biosynthesis protein